MEVENKGKPPSFPSNYVTIHQLRQRWLQQQQQSPSSLPTTVIHESNHRDDGDVIESSSSSAAAASKKPPQNDTVSAHSPPPPPVTISPSSYNNNTNIKPPFSSISSFSGGGFKKKSLNDAVSPSPPAKTKSPSSSQQQLSPSSSLSSLPTTVIPKSNHRDSGDVVDSSLSTAVLKKKTQNDTVSARFSKSPSSYYTKNKTHFSSISSSSSSRGFKKKPQTDAVSPAPLAKTKSPLISQKNPHSRIVSKTPKETMFGNPHRAPTPQQPELEPGPEPKHTDSIVVTTTTTTNNNNNTLGTDFANDVTDKSISVSNDNQVLKKKKRKNKKKNIARVLPDQNVTGASSLSETDRKLDLEVVVGEKEQESGQLGGGRKPNKNTVRELKMGQELEEVVVVEKKQRPREIRRRRNWDKKGEGEYNVKTASFDQNKAGVGDNVVEPKAEPELEAARESKMGQELEEVVVEKQQQQLRERESRGCRDWNKNRVKEFRDKTASFDQNKQAVGDNNVVEPELEVEMEVVVWKGQESPELGGCRESNKKVVRESKMASELEEVVDKKQILMETRGRRAVWKYKPKTASFGQYDSNSNNVDYNVVGGGGVMAVEDDKVVCNGDVGDGGGGGGVKVVEDDKVVGNVDVGGGGDKAVEVDKVVCNGEVVKENSRHASGKLNLRGQGQGKQSLKAASFDQDQDMSESPVKERDAVHTNYNNNYYNRNRNATGNGGSIWRMGPGRFRGQGIERPSYSKPLVSTSKGEVWVKKGESIKPNLSSSKESFYCKRGQGGQLKQKG